MKTTNLIPPNTEYLELNFVGETATGRGNNQQYVMENLHDGTFRGTESRVALPSGATDQEALSIPWKNGMRYSSLRFPGIYGHKNEKDGTKGDRKEYQLH